MTEVIVAEVRQNLMCEEITATEITSEIQEDDDGIEYKDVRTDAIARMQQARQMIRSYTIYALSAFKDFNAADIEEVRLKFRLS